MPRDLFTGTFTNRHTPRRSKWTIAGSFVAHAALVGVLLVVPVLSALDNYVVQAHNVSFVVPPAPVMPAVPAPPPPKTAVPVPDVNPNAAPNASPEKPVTTEPDRLTTGAPGPPGGIPGVVSADSRGVLGTGSGETTLVPPPPLPKPKPLPVGGNVSAPTRTYYIDPVYPQIAIAAHVDGMVILEATIDETGVVRDVKVLRSKPLLDQAAMDAVRKWRYTPGRLNGSPVAVFMTVTVTFSLRQAP